MKLTCAVQAMIENRTIKMSYNRLKSNKFQLNKLKWEKTKDLTRIEVNYLNHMKNFWNMQGIKG